MGIHHFEQRRVEIDTAVVLRILDGAGTTVTCIQGCLWVTRDGCVRDFELAPGASYQVTDGARVIVSAFGPSLAHVTRPAAQPVPAPRRPSLLGRWQRSGRRVAVA